MKCGDEVSGTEWHRRLAQRYGQLPFRLPVNGLLIELLGEVFSEQEARLAAAFPLQPATAESLSHGSGVPLPEVQQLLAAMDQSGVIGSFPHPVGRKYLLVPPIPGFFEMLMWSGAPGRCTRRFAELMHEYYDRTYYAAPARGVVKVIPVQRHIEAQVGVLSTDRVSELIESHASFGLARCCCRHAAQLREDPCSKPLEVCMSFGHFADYVIARNMARRVGRAEIRDAALLAEEAGLVHIADNVARANFLCSCCSCCCTALKVITTFDTPWMIANSHFTVTIDRDRCQGCGSCLRRCPAGALELETVTLQRGQKHSHAVIDGERCIGCGLCVSACSSNHALQLVSRSSYTPPHATLPELAADLGLQATKLGRALSGWAPGPSGWLRSRLASYIGRSFAPGRIPAPAPAAAPSCRDHHSHRCADEFSQD